MPNQVSLHAIRRVFHHNSQDRLPSHYHLKWKIHKLKMPKREKNSLHRILFCLLAIRTLLETVSCLTLYKLHKKNQVIRIKFSKTDVSSILSLSSAVRARRIKNISKELQQKGGLKTIFSGNILILNVLL